MNEKNWKNLQVAIFQLMSLELKDQNIYESMCWPELTHCCNIDPALDRYKWTYWRMTLPSSWLPRTRAKDYGTLIWTLQPGRAGQTRGSSTRAKIRTTSSFTSWWACRPSSCCPWCCRSSWPGTSKPTRRPASEKQRRMQRPKPNEVLHPIHTRFSVG